MAYEEEDSGIGLGKVAAGIGALGTAIVFRKNIGRYAKDYYKNFVKETEPNPDPIVPKFKKEVQRNTERLEDPAAPGQPLANKKPEYSLTEYKAAGDEIDKADNARLDLQKAREKENQFIIQQKKLVKERPLTLGGAQPDNDMYGIGSPLYDYVVEAVPNGYPRSVDYWKKMFGAKKMNYNFVALNRKVPTTITKQEIADTNIARFDEQGNLVDGYLKYVEDMNYGSKQPQKILPSSILSLIRNAPANNLITMEYNSADFAKEGKLYSNELRNIIRKIAMGDNKVKGNFEEDDTNLLNQLSLNIAKHRNIRQANARYNALYNLYNQSLLSDAYYTNAGGYGAELKLVSDEIGEYNQLPMNSVAAPVKSLAQRLLDFNRNLRAPENKSIENDRIIKFFESPARVLGKGYEGTDPDTKVIDVVKKLSEATDRFSGRMKMFVDGTRGDNAAREGLKDLNFFNLLSVRDKAARDAKGRLIKKEGEAVAPLKNVSPYNEYSGLEAYRTYGTENFFETVILINPKVYKRAQDQVPGLDLNPKLDNVKHFNRKLPSGEIMNAQILHVRGGVRAVHPTFGGKTVSIDEVQDDIGQSIEKQIAKDQIQKAADRYKAEQNRIRANDGVELLTDQDVRNIFTKTRTRAQIDKNFKEFGRELNPNLKRDAKLMKEPVIPDSEITRLYTTPAPDLPNPSQFLFDETAKIRLQRNMFNLDTLNANMYRDRLMTVADEMENLAKPSMTPEDVKSYNRLANTYEDIKKIIPDVSRREKSKYDYKPLDGKETWGPLAMKYAIKKAAREGIDWVSINPYEVTHHRERKRLGNLEFYGNSKGTGQITVRKAGEVFEEELEEVREMFRIGSRTQEEGPGAITELAEIAKKPKFYDRMTSSAKTDLRPGKTSGREAKNPTATLPSFLRQFAKTYDTEVKEIKVAKSDPNKRVKFVREIDSIDPETGEEIVFEEHVAAMTMEEYEAFQSSGGRLMRGNQFDDTGTLGYDFLQGTEVKIREPGEINEADYYLSYAIKIKPEFKDVPIKGYKKGGLAVNIFKW